MAKIVGLQKPDDWSDQDCQEYLEGRLMRLAAIQENYKKCGKPEEVILFRIGTYVLK